MRRWNTLLAAVICGVLSLVAYANPASSQSQVLNPLFVEARDLQKEIAGSSLNKAAKSAFQTRFAGLNAEQQSLWQMAGQVDGGQCAGPCINLYNSRIVNWQGQLQQFNADAKRWLKLTQSPNIMACWQECAAKEDKCRKEVCLTGPIEKNNICISDCHDKEMACSTRCAQ